MHLFRITMTAALGAALASLALPLWAQAPDFKRDEQLAEMRKLDWMVGEWRGQGTAEFIPGRKVVSDSHEVIRKQLDGLALSVEGIGTRKGPDGQPVKVHHAFAVIRWSPECKCYRFPSHTMAGSFVEAEMRVDGDAVVWGFKAGQGAFRYTLRQTPAGQWHEIGERSMDGKTWVQFFEMLLERVR